MTSPYTDSVNKLIEQLGRLPGIGPKSAQRLAFYILNAEKNEALALAEAIRTVKDKVKTCRTCHNLSETDICPICRDPARDSTVICIVEQPNDLVCLEKTGLCKWIYHILGGHIAPLQGVEPEHLNIEDLLQRVKSGAVKEVVMATNPTLEGDGTALYISTLLKTTGVKITRLARGLATGSTIEFAGPAILAEAIISRQQFE
jgi:recombination protein RecR